MAECGDEITGEELITLINRTNTSQDKLQSLSALKDYIISEGLNADVIMISLLQDISQKLSCLSTLTDNSFETNKLLSKIYNHE
jgi:hypothetical protein